MRQFFLYALLIVGAVLAFLAIDAYGSAHLTAPPGAAARPGASAGRPAGDIFFHVLLAMAAMIAASRLLGLVCRRVGQPQVIGEVVAGILLGPSLLGHAWPEA